MAYEEEEDRGVDIKCMNPLTTDRAPDQRQQRPRRWDTGPPADAGNAAGQQGEGQRCESVSMPDTQGYAKRMERQWRTSGSKTGARV